MTSDKEGSRTDDIFKTVGLPTWPKVSDFGGWTEAQILNSYSLVYWIPGGPGLLPPCKTCLKVKNFMGYEKYSQLY